MQFDLTDEQKLLETSLNGLIDDVGRKRTSVARFDEGRYADNEIWPLLKQMSICGLLVSSERGGLGDELLSLAIAAEALAHGAIGTPLVQQSIAAWLLAATNTDDIASVIDGDQLAAFALYEPEGRWLPAEWRITGPRLSGCKGYVIGAQDADIFIVGLAHGRFGLVEKNAAGLRIEAQSSVDRTRPLGLLQFDQTPVRELLGPDDLGSRLYDALLVWVAADACGAARRIVKLSVDYAKERRQFDRPIGSFQALKHQLANMALDVEPCRAMMWYAAHAWDRLPGEVAHSAALAKAHITDVAMRTGRAAVEAHGGMGFTWEYPLHLWLKRALFDYAFMGGVETHRARAAELAGW